MSSTLASLASAREFADGEYARALRKGGLLAHERQTVVSKLAKLKGLSEQEVLRADLRMDESRFRAESGWRKRSQG
jgi:hypothetical protein